MHPQGNINFRIRSTRGGDGICSQNARPLNNMEKGVSVKSVEDIRWLRCDIKSLNLLGSVLAKQEAHEAGCSEAILHRDGLVTEGVFDEYVRNKRRNCSYSSCYKPNFKRHYTASRSSFV